MAKEKQQPKNNKNKSEVTSAPEVSVVPRLKIVYKENVVPSLLKKFGYKNVMQVPRLEKIAINVDRINEIIITGIVYHVFK